jgi:hypothetical protein
VAGPRLNGIMKSNKLVPMILVLAGLTFAQSNADRDKADEYRRNAAKLDQKALRHEAEADRLAKNSRSNPMAHKWPAMVQGPIDRERRLAMQARRAAAESRELAAKLDPQSKVKQADED